MPIPTDKPTKKCQFCNKDVINLGLHIINQHPKIMDQLDESYSTPSLSPNLIQNTPIQQQNRPTGSDINAMIREKLDTMLNIKIIEMLSSSKDVSLIDIKKSLEPTQNTSLSDVKALHDMIYDQNKGSAININAGEEGNGWLDLATAALPILGQLIPKRMEEKQNDTEYRRIEERSDGSLRPISQEIAEYRGESESPGKESGIIVSTKQQNDSIITAIDPGNK
jgi:hypothetical protein